ncbi:MAG: protein kinase [Myxococcales bacterium]|nr:protein kinase [Myxococcales bacterium]
MPVATLIDSVVGEYRVLRLLGEGGMGQVFEAVHPVIGKHVAVKVLRLELAQDERLVRRFIEEARAVTAIRHHSIVDVFGFGTLPDGRLYLVMDLLVGESFSDYLRAEGRLSPAIARKWLLELLDAVAAAHQAGVVHRDLKPSNLFLVGATGEERLKVLDFGISRREQRSEELTRPNMLLGSPAYIAPEQIRGEASQASDLYSIGCIAFAMLTGRTVFRGELVDVLNQHLVTPAPAPTTVVPTVPPALDDFVLSLLEKEPAHRPVSARAARETLATLSLEEGPRLGPRPAPATERIALAGRTSVTATAAPMQSRVEPEGTRKTLTAPDVADLVRVPAVAAQPEGARSTAPDLMPVANDLVRQAEATQGGSEKPRPRSTEITLAPTDFVETPTSTNEAAGTTLGDLPSVTTGRSRLMVGAAVVAAIAVATGFAVWTPSEPVAERSSSGTLPAPPPPAREPTTTEVVTTPPPSPSPRVALELTPAVDPPAPEPTTIAAPRVALKPPAERTPPVEPPASEPTTIAAPRVAVKAPAERTPPVRPGPRPGERPRTTTPDGPGGDRLARTATHAELEARLARDEAAVASGRARGGKNAALLLEDARATLSASRSADERVNLQSFLDEWEQRYLPR